MLGKYLRSALVLLLLVMAPALPAQPAASPPIAAARGLIPAADFARVPFITLPRLSPDGTVMAGLFNRNGEQVIAMLNLADHTDHPVFVGLPEGTEVAQIYWVNNDNLVVSLYALKPVEGDRWIVSRLLGVNRKTGKLTKIMWDAGGQNASDVIWIASDGSPQIMVAAQDSIYVDDGFWPAVYKVNVETGARTLVQKGRETVMNWFADSAGNVRAGEGYEDNSRTFRLLYRGPEGGNFKTVDNADTRKREVLTEPFLFLPGTSHALAVHDDPQGHSAVFEIDMLTQQDVRTVYSAPEGSEVESVEISADGKGLLGVSYAGRASGMTWLDPDLAQLQDAIAKSVPGQRARIVSMNANRTRFLILIDRPDNPGSLYFFDINGTKLQRLAILNDGLGTAPLNPVKLVSYKARDGLEIEAVLTLPRDRPAKNLPIVVLPHGGPWAQDTLDYDYWAQFIASRGYAVIQPNFRGSTGYGTDFLRKGEGQLGFAMQDDLSDALAWAVTAGIADPKRACIVGASYGGYAAMWGIAKDPDQYRCAISIAGVSNLRRDVNSFGSYVMGKLFRDDWQRMTPDFAAVSPINAIARIKAPLLLIHGRKDITVDFGQSQAMFDKMRGAGKVVDLVALPLADHHFTREADRLVLLTSIEAFLFKYNPPDPVSPGS